MGFSLQCVIATSVAPPPKQATQQPLKVPKPVAACQCQANCLHNGDAGRTAAWSRQQGDIRGRVRGDGRGNGRGDSHGYGRGDSHGYTAAETAAETVADSATAMVMADTGSETINLPRKCTYRNKFLKILVYS